MPQRRPGAGGFAFAASSAAVFGTSGVFGSALIDAGWTPGAAVTARIICAALLLTVPALVQLRGRWELLRRGARGVTVFGLVAIAGAQLCYFNAVAHLSVGVALLLEYSGTILVVGWLWLRHGHTPRRLTVIGGATSLAGLLLVLDLLGSQRLDPVGVLWGLGAATGLAVFFVLSAGTRDPLPPLVLVWGGMSIGALALVAAGVDRGAPAPRATRGRHAHAPPGELARPRGRPVGRGRRCGLCPGHPRRADARREAGVVRRPQRGAVRDHLRVAVPGAGPDGSAGRGWCARPGRRGVGAGRRAGQ